MDQYSLPQLHSQQRLPLFSLNKLEYPPALQFPFPPITKFKIGLCQLKVTADKENNILHARTALEEAAEKGAISQAFFLPFYVASFSPARDVGAGYIAWGHSTLVGPFGEVLATTEHGEAIIISNIDYSQIELMRKNLSLEKQRRTMFTSW